MPQADNFPCGQIGVPPLAANLAKLLDERLVPGIHIFRCWNHMRHRLPMPADSHSLATFNGAQKLGKAGLGLCALNINHFGKRSVTGLVALYHILQLPDVTR